MRKIILILLSLFSMASYAYDACQAYHPYNNPNPSVPCSYNGYDYDSLAVEAGVNSFFYKGQNYNPDRLRLVVVAAFAALRNL